MDDNLHEVFVGCVNRAIGVIEKDIAPNYPERKMEIDAFTEILKHLQHLPSFDIAFSMWAELTLTVYKTSKCDCPDRENHQLLGRIAMVCLGQQTVLQTFLMRRFLDSLELDEETIEKVIEAMEQRFVKMATEQEEISNKVPDFVPADWENKSGE